MDLAQIDDSIPLEFKWKLIQFSESGVKIPEWNDIDVWKRNLFIIL